MIAHSNKIFYRLIRVVNFRQKKLSKNRATGSAEGRRPRCLRSKNDTKKRLKRLPKPPNPSQNPSPTPPRRSPRPVQIPFLSDFRTFIFLLQICSDFFSIFYGFVQARNPKNRAPVEARAQFSQNHEFRKTYQNSSKKPPKILPK